MPALQCQPWATWLGSRRAVCAPNHWTIKNVNLMCVFTTVESDLSLHLHVYSEAQTWVSRLALPTWAIHHHPTHPQPTLRAVWATQFSGRVTWIPSTTHTETRRPNHLSSAPNTHTRSKVDNNVFPCPGFFFTDLLNSLQGCGVGLYRTLGSFPCTVQTAVP